MRGARLTHVGLCVSDAERSLRFYCDGLGFERVRELDVEGDLAATLLDLPGVVLRALYLVRDGVCIELLHYPTPGTVGDASARPMNQLGLTHLSLHVEDLDGAIATLETAGGRVVAGTRVEDPSQGVRAVFVTDPDGTRVELVERR